MFEECIAPLVDGLFQGYNGTVLAYGQVISYVWEICFANEKDLSYSLGLFHCLMHTCMMQTGSGKTYTMGTGSKDGSQTGLIPQVMDALFSKIETLKNQTEFHLQVSFIEVHRYFPAFFFFFFL